MEPLDARVVPAVMTWQGYSGVDIAFSNPDNWLQDGNPASRAPQTGDDLVFSGYQTQTDCMGMTGNFDSITIESYVSVYLAGDVEAVTFDLHGGEVRNTANGQDITVTGTFDWTVGNVNPTYSSNSYTGTVYLSGAVATVAPGESNTIITGSTLSLDPRAGIGATATITPGTIQFDGIAGIILNDKAEMFLNARTPQGQAANVTFSGDGKPWSENDTQIQVNAGGKITVTGPGTWRDEKHVLNNNGAVEIKGNAIAIIGPGAGLEPSYGFKQTAGNTRLHSGSTLSGTSAGVLVSGGEFQIVADSPNGETETAKVDSAFTFTGGAVGFLGNYWTFEVTRHVLWTGGTYAPRVDVTGASGAGLADIWLIRETLSIPATSTAKIKPSSINYETIPAQWRVKIFDIRRGVEQGSIMPVLENQNPGPVYVYHVGQPGGTQRVWYFGPG